MDTRKLNCFRGFTLLELLIVLILIGLISTVLVINSPFLERYNKESAGSYIEFIQFLSEESTLTKKTIAWFVTNEKQSINYFKDNNWHSQQVEAAYFPVIQNNTLFTDASGKVFMWVEKVDTPFLIFYPSGESSGGMIEFNKLDQRISSTIDNFGSMSTHINYNESQ